MILSQAGGRPGAAAAAPARPHGITARGTAAAGAEAAAEVPDRVRSDLWLRHQLRVRVRVRVQVQVQVQAQVQVQVQVQVRVRAQVDASGWVDMCVCAWVGGPM